MQLTARARVGLLRDHPLHSSQAKPCPAWLNQVAHSYSAPLLETPETNVQTTHVSAGGATAVEFTARVPGTYSIVDHSLGRIEKGAAGQIVVDGPDQPDIFRSIRAGNAGSGGH